MKTPSHRLIPEQILLIMSQLFPVNTWIKGICYKKSVDLQPTSTHDDFTNYLTSVLLVELAFTWMLLMQPWQRLRLKGDFPSLLDRALHSAIHCKAKNNFSILNSPGFLSQVQTKTKTGQQNQSNLQTLGALTLRGRLGNPVRPRRRCPTPLRPALGRRQWCPPPPYSITKLSWYGRKDMTIHEMS